MNLSKPKIFLILGVAAAIFWFVSDDEPVLTEQAEAPQRNTKPVLKPDWEREQYSRQSNQYSQVPAFTPPAFNHYGQPPAADNRWQSQYPESRFRPLDKSRDKAEGSKPDYRKYQPAPPSFSYGPDGQTYPQFHYNDGRTQADSMSGRFRPWDEKRQSRRWQGNFRRMTHWPEQLAAPLRYSPLRLAYAD